jgi:tryptophanyl-tRNA synthetase
MTTITDHILRRQSTDDIALDYLDCVLDPKKATLFRQSDVPEVTELMWLLSSVTPMGLLERCHSYKDKKARLAADDLDRVNHGVFAYPVLMAADILIYDSTLVPVGRDQKQHVEVTRDIALKFNHIYGETFVIPEARIRDAVAVVPGLDGQKMSKSYGNTIELFSPEKVARKRIMSIVMDSRSPTEPKPDADQNLALRLLKLFSSPEVCQDLEDRLRAGGLGYGELKTALFERYWSTFATARARRAELEQDLGYLADVLQKGAARVRPIAQKVLSRAKHAAGLS